MKRTFGLTGEGRDLFLTSIHESESMSGRLADSPLGIVFKLLRSSVLHCPGVEALGDPGADSVDDTIAMRSSRPISCFDDNPPDLITGLVSVSSDTQPCLVGLGAMKVSPVCFSEAWRGTNSAQWMS